VTGDPHNSYVYLLAGGGVLALGSLLAIMLAFVVDVIRRYRRAIDIERTLLIWSLCTWFAFITNAFYGPVLSDAPMLMTIWILMILPQCVLLRGRDGPAPADNPRPVSQHGTALRGRLDDRHIGAEHQPDRVLGIGERNVRDDDTVHLFQPEDR
jgi:hypothetical protein